MGSWIMHTFTNTFTNDVTNTVVNELWYLAERDHNMRDRLRAMYGRITRMLTTQMEKDGLGSSPRARRDTAYAILSLTYGNEAFQFLGLQDTYGFVYCTPKTNSLGCIPAIAASGTPSLTDPNPFDITASMVLNESVEYPAMWGLPFQQQQTNSLQALSSS